MAAENYASAQELAKKLEASSITLKVKTGEGGKLFGSISTKEIAEAINEQLGIEIDKKKVQLTSPLKTIGESTVPIKLHTKVTAQMKVVVESL